MVQNSDDATAHSLSLPEARLRPPRARAQGLVHACLAVALAAFVALAYLASLRPYFPWDVAIAQALQSYQVAWFAALMRGLSWLGFAPQVIIISAAVVLLLLLAGYRWEGLVAAIAASGTMALNEAVKDLVRRPRPEPALVHVLRPLGSYSFPSGHVMFFIGFFGFLFFLALAILRPGWLRRLMLAFLGGLVLLIGPSRVYVGEHWPSDVLGAYLLGGIALWLAIRLYRWRRPRAETNRRLRGE